jgi:hypothetical protein
MNSSNSTLRCHGEPEVFLPSNILPRPALEQATPREDDVDRSPPALLLYGFFETDPCEHSLRHNILQAG